MFPPSILVTLVPLERPSLNTLFSSTLHPLTLLYSSSQHTSPQTYYMFAGLFAACLLPLEQGLPCSVTAVSPVPRTVPGSQ